MKLNNKVIKVFNEHDICLTNIEKDKNGCTYTAGFSGFSPLGENIIFDIEYDGTADNFCEKFKEYADDFDADEHAKMWIEHMENGNSVPQSVTLLVQDALGIKKTLVEIADEINVADIEALNEHRRRKALRELYDKLLETLDLEPCGCDDEDETKLWQTLNDAKDALYDYL